MRHTGWPIGHLYVVNQPGAARPDDRVVPRRPRGAASVFREVTEATPLRAGEGLPGRVLATGAPAWIPDVMRRRQLPPGRRSRPRSGCTAGFGFPVLVGDDVVAVLEFFAEAHGSRRALLELMGPHRRAAGPGGRAHPGRGRADAPARSSTRAVIETANDAFIAIDADSRITDWNRQAEQTFGWTRDEALGPPAGRARSSRRCTATAHAAGSRASSRTGVGPVLGRRVELTALHRDGHEFPIELTPWAVAGRRRSTASTPSSTTSPSARPSSASSSTRRCTTRSPALPEPRPAPRPAAPRPGRRAGATLAVWRCSSSTSTASRPSTTAWATRPATASCSASPAACPGVLRPGDTVARLGRRRVRRPLRGPGDEATTWPPSPTASLASLSEPVRAARRRRVRVGEHRHRRGRRPTAATPSSCWATPTWPCTGPRSGARACTSVFDETMRAALVRAAVQRAGAAPRHRRRTSCIVVLPAHRRPGDGAVVGVEALARWRRPGTGVGPAGRVHPPGRGDRPHRRRSASSCCARPAPSCAAGSSSSPDAGSRWRSTCRSASSSSPASSTQLAALLADAGVAPTSLIARDHRDASVTQDAAAMIRRLWAAPGAGRRPGHRRLRHGLLVARPAAGHAGADSSRSTSRFIDEIDATAAAPRCRRHHRHGPQPRAQRGRRGRGDAAQLATWPPRLRRRPGLPAQPARLRRRDRGHPPASRQPVAEASATEHPRFDRGRAHASRRPSGTGRGDLESTTRSLMAELQRLVSQTTAG